MRMIWKSNIGITGYLTLQSEIFHPYNLQVSSGDLTKHDGNPLVIILQIKVTPLPNSGLNFNFIILNLSHSRYYYNG